MIYTIPRYPVHLIDVVQLADGSRVTIRPTLPQDMELQRRFFRSLTAESRNRRFMTRLNELPEPLAESSPRSITAAILRCWPRCSRAGAKR